MRSSGRRTSGWRVLLLATAAAGTLALSAVPAAAHATLIGASPAANIGLGTPPELVKLRFSEPLRVPPSTIRVLDEAGRDRVRDVSAVPTDPQSMQASLPRLPEGEYRVAWRTVSTVDGHTIRGSYSFGVGRPPRSAPTASESGPLAGAGAPGIIFRVIGDGGLILLLGAALAVWLARPISWAFASLVTRRARVVALVAAAGALSTVAVEAIAAAGWSPRGWGSYLTGSIAGWARVAAAGGALLALVGTLVRRLGVAALCSGVALAAIGVSGHAAGTTRPVLFMASDAAHLIVAGSWLGVAGALLLGWSALERGQVRAIIGRASPLAITSAIALAATGSVNAAGQLTGVGDLWQTTYGGIVSAKILALLAAAGFGALHSFALRPRLERNADGDPAPRAGIRRALGAQGWVAIGAILLAATLAAFPDPPRQELLAERQSDNVPAIFAVGEGPLVTVAERSGPLLIALAIAPPEPGDVRLAVQLIDAADEQVDGLPVTIVARGPDGSEHRVAALPQCGPGCYRTRAVLDSAGVWSFAISAGERGVDLRIPLPARDGTAVFEGLERAYNDLRSLRMTEHFDSGTGVVIDTTYLFEEPDRSAVETSLGRQESTIGRDNFERAGPAEPWKHTMLRSDRPGPILFLWSRVEHARLLEDTTIEGRPAYTLALFDPFGIWYRVAVDKQTMLPVADRMRAIGHFMDRTFSRFDQDLDIEAPPNARREET